MFVTMARSAGIIIWANDTGRVLLLLRSLDSGSPVTWGIPGGRIDDDDDSPQAAAMRELVEETGYEGPLEMLFDRTDSDDRYTTFVALVLEEFDVELNDEHIDGGWFDKNDLPSPLHPGLVAAAFPKGLLP